MQSVVTLDLASLRHEVDELDPRVVDALALAASVVVDSSHGQASGVAACFHRHGDSRQLELRTLTVDERARATYGDWQEAVEEGAEAIALAVARRLMDLIPFRRLPKRTGADYFVRPLRGGGSDVYERLECSGIASQREDLEQRLRSKLRQLAHYDSPPGHAVVTHFGRSPIAIAAERWP